MILVDTSVWIDYLRAGDVKLVTLLNNTQVFTHPFVVGELACGNLQNRSEILTLLNELPHVTVASDNEVLMFIQQHSLMGRGVGYIDAHLLAAASLAAPARLWTRDKRLATVAADMELAH